VTDLTSRITAALDEQQRLAEAATPGPWEARSYVVAGPRRAGVALALSIGDREVSDAAFIAANDPASVLRRVAAQRRVLERHQPEEYGEATEFEGVTLPALVACGRCQDNFDQYPVYPCDEIKDLADALGVDVTGVEAP
jgi:hypothetical protein